ncbi:hypothetical protein HK405_002468 [Cladochytrium tenue]|nr:hypothetical protein HK405_002468 [Cladochytrium tenue]
MSVTPLEAPDPLVAAAATPTQLRLSPMDAVMANIGLTMLFVFAPPAATLPQFDLHALHRSFRLAVQCDFPFLLAPGLRIDPTDGAVCLLPSIASDIGPGGDGDSEGPGHPPFYSDPACLLDAATVLRTLPGEQLMPVGARRGITGPPLAVKCSILADGGLAIGFDSAHALFDGRGFYTFMQRWGEHYRGVHDAQEVVPCIDRRLLDPAIPIASFAPVFDHPEFRVMPPKPPQSTPAGAPPLQLPETRQRAFHVPTSALQRLKALAGGSPPSDGERTDSGMRVSSTDALTALLVVLMSRARGHGLRVRFTTGVDARQYFDPPLPLGYVGNVVFNALAHAEADEIAAVPDVPAGDHAEDDGGAAAAGVSVGALRAIARRLRAAIAHTRDPAFLRDAVGFVASRGQSAVGVSTDFFLGPDLMFTSHARLGATSVDFGSGPPAYADVPTLPVCDGLAVFIEATPACQRDGLEVIVFLERAAMERFEGEWTKAAQALF